MNDESEYEIVKFSELTSGEEQQEQIFFRSAFHMSS